MQKRLLFLILFFCLICFELAAQSITMWSAAQKSWLKQQKKMYLMQPDQVDRLLPRLHTLFPDFTDRLRALSILRLGTPYNTKAIGDGQGYEPAPVFTVQKTNCTVQILTNTALAHAFSYAEAESLMAFINYYPVKPGQKAIRYENRRHYTSDRILSCDYYEEYTSKIAQTEQLDSIRIILNRKQDGTHFLPIDWQKEIVMPYLPKSFIIKEVLDRLPPVCGVGLIRKKLFKLGIVVAHEGMILDGQTFVHASSSARKVIAENFSEYCIRDNRLYGVIFYLFKEVK